MSAFNRCKHCGDTDPASGWVGSSKSLCGACAHDRKVNKTKLRRDLEEVEGKVNTTRAMIAAAMLLGGGR